MNKPLSVAYEEFKQNLAGLINDSGLPAFMFESVLQGITGEVRAIAQRQYEAEKAQYEASLQNEKLNSNTTE